jgi:hypothetical protein
MIYEIQMTDINRSQVSPLQSVGQHCTIMMVYVHIPQNSELLLLSSCLYHLQLKSGCQLCCDVGLKILYSWAIVLLCKTKNHIFLDDTPNARYKILYFWMIVLLCKTKNHIFLDDTASNARYKILYFWMIVLLMWNLKSCIPVL